MILKCSLDVTDYYPDIMSNYAVWVSQEPGCTWVEAVQREFGCGCVGGRVHKNRRFFVLEKERLGHFIFSSLCCQKGQRSNVRAIEEFQAACRQIRFRQRGRGRICPKGIGACICVSLSQQLFCLRYLRDLETSEVSLESCERSFHKTKKVTLAQTQVS